MGKNQIQFICRDMSAQLAVSLKYSRRTGLYIQDVRLAV